jgi:hypothetical protein
MNTLNEHRQAEFILTNIDKVNPAFILRVAQEASKRLSGYILHDKNTGICTLSDDWKSELLDREFMTVLKEKCTLRSNEGQEPLKP